MPIKRQSLKTVEFSCTQERCSCGHLENTDCASPLMLSIMRCAHWNAVVILKWNIILISFFLPGLWTPASTGEFHRLGHCRGKWRGHMSALCQLHLPKQWLNPWNTGPIYGIRRYDDYYWLLFSSNHWFAFRYCKIPQGERTLLSFCSLVTPLSSF